jgi:hypothetical protein
VKTSIPDATPSPRFILFQEGYGFRLPSSALPEGDNNRSTSRQKRSKD